MVTHLGPSARVNSLFLFLGSWDIKGGTCETDPAGNWRAGGSAVGDRLRHGRLLFTEESVFRVNYRSTQCVQAAARGMAFTPHRIYLPVLFSVRPLPAGAPGDQPTLGVHDSTQNPFLHLLFVSMSLMISCALFFLMHETDLPSFFSRCPSFLPLFFSVCF